LALDIERRVSLDAGPPRYGCLDRRQAAPVACYLMPRAPTETAITDARAAPGLAQLG